MTVLFPIILMILDFCAAVVYFINGDVRHGIYWLAALVLTSMVTI